MTVGFALHRIEAMPGEGRYTVTFRGTDGADVSAVAQVSGELVQVPASALPTGWSADSASHAGLLDAVRALHAARAVEVTGPALRDVDGGWDVGLGNVVLGADGVPTCTAHGAMQERAGVWSCAECGAGATFG